MIISDKLDDNTIQKLQEDEKKNYNIDYSDDTLVDGLISFGGGVLYSPLQTFYGVTALGQGIPELGYRLITGESFDEAFTNTIDNNLGIKMSRASDNFLHDLGIRKKDEELTDAERTGRFISSFIPTNRLSFVTKAGKVVKGAEKLKDAGYYGIVPIKTTLPSHYNKLSYLLPGVQIEKGKKITQQLPSIGIQSGLIYGLDPNSPIHKEEEPQQNEQLIKDFRKNPEDPNNIIEFNQEELNNVQDSEEGMSTFTKILLAGGALYGSSKLYNKYLETISKNTSLNELDSETINSLSKQLSKKEQFGVATTDRFGYSKNLYEEGLISEEINNELARDTMNIVEQAYKTGNLGDGFKTSISLKDVLLEADQLKASNPEKFQQLDELYDIATRIQHDAHRFNIKRGEKVYMSTDSYVKLMTKPNINNLLDNSYIEPNELINMIDRYNQLKINIKKDPQLNKIFNEINEVNQTLLEKQYKEGVFSLNTYNKLKKNREFFGDFIYKHAVMDNNDTFFNSFSKYLLREMPIDSKMMPDLSTRGEFGLKNSKLKSFTESMEQDFKQTLYKLEENKRKREFIHDLEKNINNKIEDIYERYIPEYKSLQREYASAKSSKNKKAMKQAKEYQDVLYKAYVKNLKEFLHIKKLGVKDIDNPNRPIEKARELDAVIGISANNKDLNNPLFSFVQNYQGQTTDLTKYDGIENISKDVISFFENGKLHYYRTDPIIAASFNVSGELTNILSKLMRSTKNFVQSTITGKFNPLFALPSGIMTTNEALVVFNKIAQDLSVMDSASRLDYIKQIGKSFKEIETTMQTEDLINSYSREIMKNEDINSINPEILNLNINKLRFRYNNLLNTQISALGGASQKPTTVNGGKFFTLRPKMILSEATKERLVNLYGVQGAISVAKLINYYQIAMREAPQLALTEYFGKLSGAIRNNKVVDEKTMQKVIKAINDNTATVSKFGTGAGLSGSISDFIANYFTYGQIMLQSLASKAHASNINKGLDELIRTFKYIGNDNFTISDFISRLRMHGSDLLQNKFFQGLITVSFIPTIIQYLWNNGSNSNKESYSRLSTYDKASKNILVNVFGEGNHLFIPKDQEVAIFDAITYTILDSIFNLSQNVENNPAYTESNLIKNTLSRSFGLDSIPALDLLANSAGYDISFNIFDDKKFISPLPKNVINNDLSETATMNGLVNQESKNLVNSIFGVLGSAILGSAEEYNVGSNNNEGLSDATSSFIDKMTRPIQLFGSKPTNSYNETSTSVYNSRRILSKIMSITNKNETQNQIYELVKIYNKNRIKPIHDEITKYRKEMQKISGTGRDFNNNPLNYSERKNRLSEIQQEMQNLFALEYQEFKNLDKLIKLRFNNNELTLENFMEKTNGTN